MNHRTLGRTGIKVSEVGYGSWGIGQKQWLGSTDDESIRALHKAIDLGLNYIDTALAYGDGHSERLVGRVIKERSEKITVATKIPPMNLQWPAKSDVPVEEVFPRDHVIRSTEESLRNLGVDHIDLQQLHVWNESFLNQGDWLSTLEKLKKDGKIGYFGVSVTEHRPDQALPLVESGVVDTIQEIYNVFDQSAEDHLFAACQKQNVGVIVRVPLDEGGLTGKITPETKFEEDDFRAFYFKGDRKQKVYDRIQKLVQDLDLPPERLPETALRFALSHPAVSTIIPGMRRVAHVESNCAVGDGKGLPKEMIQKLRAHRWDRSFYLP